jgi:hypothetical protein
MLNTVIELCRKLTSENFWGELTLKFRNGKISLVTKSEQIKGEE